MATPRVLRAFEASGDLPLTYLQRHLSGDWGDLDAHDVHENEESLKHGWRILSAYNLSDGTKIWIITEANRTVTTFFAGGVLGEKEMQALSLSAIEGGKTAYLIAAYQHYNRNESGVAFREAGDRNTNIPKPC